MIGQINPALGSIGAAKTGAAKKAQETEKVGGKEINKSELEILKKLATRNNMSLQALIDKAEVTKDGHVYRLNLQGTSFSDLTGIEGLTHLFELNLSETNVSDLKSVKWGQLKNLQIVKLYKCKNVSDISPLAQTGITTLSISHSNVSSLVSLPATLKVLYATNLPKGTDFAPISSLADLTILYVNQNPSGLNLEQVFASPSLMQLNITGSNVKVPAGLPIDVIDY